MRQYKALISLVCLGFGLAVIGQSVFIPFEPAPATVTEANLTALPRSSDHPPRYRSSFTYEYIYRVLTSIFIAIGSTPLINTPTSAAIGVKRYVAMTLVIP